MAFFSFDELFETSPEVADAVVNVEIRSTGEWLVITETTRKFIPGFRWFRTELRIRPFTSIFLDLGSVGIISFSTTFLPVGGWNYSITGAS